MIGISIYSSDTGEILGQRSCSEEDLEQNLQLLDLNELHVFGFWDGETQYIMEGVVTQRPKIHLSKNYAVLTNTDWHISDVPEGTKVEIDGEIMGLTDETGLTLSFAAPGIWPVTLRPPFPWIEASCEVTVT
jgi:hypothetical protein